jgi:hypothetical protein
MNNLAVNGRAIRRSISVTGDAALPVFSSAIPCFQSARLPPAVIENSSKYLSSHGIFRKAPPVPVSDFFEISLFFPCSLAFERPRWLARPFMLWAGPFARFG